MAREADSYRGARRNKVLRELKTTWGPQHYYEAHHRPKRKKQRRVRTAR